MRIDWPDYHRVHADRTNLIIHLVAVPLFAVSFVLLLYYLARSEWVSAIIVLGLAGTAMALQGRGHKIESEAPRPFAGPFDFLRRWFTEQFVTFPVFVLTGRWWRQFRDGNES